MARRSCMLLALLALAVLASEALAGESAGSSRAYALCRIVWQQPL